MLLGQRLLDGSYLGLAWGLGAAATLQLGLLVALAVCQWPDAWLTTVVRL